MFAYFERQMFKEVPGGYIFQPPPPTRFHHTQAYVVNEAQRQQIEVVTRDGRTFWLRTVTLTALAIAIAIGVLADANGAPLWLGVFLGFCAWLIAQIVGTAAVMHLKLRQLEPVLAGLPRSDERLFPELNRRQLLVGPPAARYAALWCTVFAFFLGRRFEQHPPFPDLVSIVCIGALALNLFWAFRGARTAVRSTNELG